MIIVLIQETMGRKVVTINGKKISVLYDHFRSTPAGALPLRIESLLPAKSAAKTLQRGGGGGVVPTTRTCARKGRGVE